MRVNLSNFSRLKKPTLQTRIIIIASVVLVGFSVVVPVAWADRYQEQINQLRRQNQSSEAARADLRAGAASLEETIAALQAEISAVESQIRANQAERAELARKIKKFEAQLAKERRTLGVNIKQMYVESDMSTLERLASSKNLSEYIDRDQYRISVQDKITATMERIEQLKAELDKQKQTVEKLLKDQKEMRGNLAAKRAENNRLLSLNKSQQAAFNQNISANNSRISELQRQQAIENARHNVGAISYSGSGGYPWANAPFPNSMSDPWGMYKRQCVSYTAWKVSSTGRHMPYWGGRGNAKLWDDNARAAGIPVNYSPRAGDVAISNSGTYGHAMYVERVHGDGTITVSQYNAGWDGRYSVVRRSTAGLVFIHF